MKSVSVQIKYTNKCQPSCYSINPYSHDILKLFSIFPLPCVLKNILTDFNNIKLTVNYLSDDTRHGFLKFIFYFSKKGHQTVRYQK